jgi:chromosome segregation ATPase
MASHSATYEMYSQHSNAEKDLLISQLKAEIFEKEQMGKNFTILQSKFRNLQNDYQLLCEEKLNLEYELKGKTENGNKAISELQLQNENILNELNDKIAMNKKLYNDNDNLYRTFETKKNENLRFRNQLAEQEELLAKLSNDKNVLQRQILTMNQTKQSHLTNIQTLQDELHRLNQLYTLKEQNIKDQIERNQQMVKELNSQQSENNALKSKLQFQQDSLNNFQKQLSLANDTITKMDRDLHLLSNQLYKNKSELNNLNNDLKQESSRRDNIERNNQRLESIIKERDIDINKMNNENNELNMNIEGINNDIQNLNGELEKYKQHIMLLTEQNDKLSNELEVVLDRDMKLRMMLNRTERLGMLTEQNRQIVENSLDNLKAYLERTELNNSRRSAMMNTQHSSFIAGSKGFEKQPATYELH